MNCEFRNIWSGLKCKIFLEDPSESINRIHELIHFGTGESIHTEYESVHGKVVESIKTESKLICYGMDESIHRVYELIHTTCVECSW